MRANSRVYESKCESESKAKTKSQRKGAATNTYTVILAVRLHLVSTSRGFFLDKLAFGNQSHWRARVTGSK